ncbi:MAG: ADP-glyceromanno-heptose 6-epimerase [Spirochaetales bacterium]|nr:ADP-glyceromanno-heptose 6-epimerase [Spirochaetales bacterium]MCP5486251.1 ADP-glyceromanno-heptose 6-epimerase [Spirochaetales bacterium]
MIIVTGAAGLIGSAVARELNRRGAENLILVDHLGHTEKWRYLRSISYREYFEKQDFLLRLERGQFPGIEAIVHLGANSSTTETDASHLVENNYRYSMELARVSARDGLRMVYASSAATYGDGADGFDDDPARLGELRPLNMYGYSKHMFDCWLARDQFRPGFLGLKYFNVYGPNEYHKGNMQSLVLKAFRQVQSDGCIRLFKSYHPDYADGEQKRDFLYVEDAARMTVFFALDNREATGVVNAGSGTARTWNDLARAVFGAMGREPAIEYIEMPAELRGKYQYYTCAPIERLRQAGYNQSITSIEDAVSAYVRDYLLAGEACA